MATRIYVGNLPYTADNEQLARLFSTFGDVTEASVVMDRESGRSKGFGFVQLSSDAAARSAIASLDGTLLDNRTIRVNEAQPRTERSTGFRSSAGAGRRSYSSSGYGEFDGRQDRYGRSRTRDW
ncbi:MAG: RNA recognition motif domain-containing protein [Ktedonobacterales bacterium]